MKKRLLSNIMQNFNNWVIIHDSIQLTTSQLYCHGIPSCVASSADEPSCEKDHTVKIVGIQPIH